jgi:cell growth-regulating nucleolar protein
MPSFVCDRCQETLKKAKLDAHTVRCRGASFSCIDCYRSFEGVAYRSHFSCITEVEKYEKRPVPSKDDSSKGKQAATENSVGGQKRTEKNPEVKSESRPKRPKSICDDDVPPKDQNSLDLLSISLKVREYMEREFTISLKTLIAHLRQDFPQSSKKTIRNFLCESLVASHHKKSGVISFTLRELTQDDQ